MAMILDAFVGRCLDVLQELATEEVVRILGVKDDLRGLQEKLEMIKDVLTEAERRRIQDASVNRWLSKLRDVMYDADDIIDLCRIKGSELLKGGVAPLPSTSKSVRYRRFPCFSSCFTTVASIPIRREIGKKIEKLNQRLEEISKDRLMFSLPQTSSPNLVVSRVDPRQTSPLLSSDFVGTEAKLAADGLVESLLNSQGGSLLLVFAIVGSGGIGKTTLAQKIYNHQKVQAHFQKRIWVCVSQNYSEVELLKQIIRGAGGGDQAIHAQTKAELQPLRVLDLSDSMIESIPESIRSLQHLRYLDLDRTPVSQLPESIGCLVNLQFLCLSGCNSLHTLPKSITQLCNLRSLNLYGTPLSHLPIGIGKLDHLTDLQGFVVGEDNDNDSESGMCRHGCGLDELQSMSQLRNLYIDRLERVLTGGIQPLNDKPYLKELRLEWSEDADRSSLISEGKDQILEDLSPSPSVEALFVLFFCGFKFPLWISMLPSLTILSIWNCLACQHLPPLGQLPQLRILCIDCALAVTTIGPELLGCDTEDGPGHKRTPTAFPKLEELLICSMPNWEEWVCDAKEVEGGTRKTFKLLPRLQLLQIYNCPKLRALPDGLQHAAALKQCEILNAGSLIEIKNILSLEKLLVRDSQCLERISNLPALREMTISDSCRMLKLVEKLDMLRSLSLYLEQDWMECLPEWLLGLIQVTRTNGTLQSFSLYCGETLRARCIEGGQYWPLLCHIPDISVIHRLGYY